MTKMAFHFTLAATIGLALATSSWGQVKTVNIRGRVGVRGSFQCAEVDPLSSRTAQYRNFYGAAGEGVVIVASAGQYSSEREHKAGGSWSVRGVLGNDSAHPVSLTYVYAAGNIDIARMNFGAGHPASVAPNYKIQAELSFQPDSERSHCPGLGTGANTVSISGACGANQTATFEIYTESRRVMIGTFPVNASCETLSDESGIVNSFATDRVR